MNFRQTQFLILLMCTVVFAACCKVPAQTPEGEKAIISPEQMVDEAIRRYDLGDYPEAYAYVDKVKRLKPDLMKLKLIEGLLFLEARPKRTPDAVQRLSDYNGSEEGKNDYRGLAALGKVYKDSMMFRLALRPLEKAKTLAPPEQEGKPVRALIMLDLADCYLGLKNDKQAMITAKEAEGAAPNDSNVQLELSRLATKAKDYDLALKAADRAIGLLRAKTSSNPFKSEEVKNLLECLDTKIRMYAQKLDEGNKDSQVFYEIVVSLREKSETQRRLEQLRAREYGIKGIAHDSKNFKLQVVVAAIEIDLGGLSEALERLNDTINNDPENQAAIKLRSDLQARMGTAKH